MNLESRKININLNKKLIKTWIVPLIVSIVLFITARPILAQQFQWEITLVDYLKSNNVGIGSEEKNGYRQIYYTYNENKVFITDTNYTNSQPVTEKEYIAWQAQIDNGWRIFLYHIPTNITTELTQSGNNVNPQVSGGKVAWERQVDGVWQIFLFDGTKIYQLTQGDMSLNPDIEGNVIVYGRKDLSGWRASAYSLIEKKEVDITTGETVKFPKLIDGQIYLAKEKGGVERFPLTADDLFILDLASLAPTNQNSPETVTLEDILQELEATPSASLEEAAPIITPEVTTTPALTPTLSP